MKTLYARTILTSTVNLTRTITADALHVKMLTTGKEVSQCASILFKNETILLFQDYAKKQTALSRTTSHTVCLTGVMGNVDAQNVKTRKLLKNVRRHHAWILTKTKKSASELQFANKPLM